MLSKSCVRSALAILVLMGTGAGGAAAGEGRIVRSIDVDVTPNTVCLYGNWIEGSVELLQVDGRVLLAGVQVYPRVREAIIHAEGTGVVDPLTDLIDEMHRLERSLWGQGEDANAIAAASYKLLQSSEYVAAIERVSGNTHKIVGVNGNVHYASLGKEPGISVAEKNIGLRRIENASGRYDLFLEAISGRRGVLVMSSSVTWLPSWMAESPIYLEAVLAATGAAEELTEEAWDSNYPFPHFVANEMRKPIPMDKLRRYSID